MATLKLPVMPDITASDSKKTTLYFDEEEGIVYRYIHVSECGSNVYRKEPVMDKETFIKCFEEWVKPKYGLLKVDI